MSVDRQVSGSGHHRLAHQRVLEDPAILLDDDLLQRGLPLSPEVSSACGRLTKEGYFACLQIRYDGNPIGVAIELGSSLAVCCVLCCALSWLTSAVLGQLSTIKFSKIRNLE